MDNVVRRFFSNGRSEETMFNVYQGHNKSLPYYKTSHSAKDIQNSNNTPKRKLQRKPTQIEGVNISEIMKNETSNISPNPNIIPDLHTTPEISYLMAMQSPFMSLKKGNIIPQPKNVLESVYPTFDNALFLVPKKKEENPPISEQKAINLKLQMLEEKLKNSETKRVMLETVNRNIVLEEEKKHLEKMKTKKEDPLTQLNLDTVAVLKQIREEITKKLVDDGQVNRENFTNLNNEITLLKSELSDKFLTLEQRQLMQVQCMKYILQHSGSSRLKNLSKRVLTENYYDVNNLSYKFVNPTSEELKKATEEINKNRHLKRTQRDKNVAGESFNNPFSKASTIKEQIVNVSNMPELEEIKEEKSNMDQNQNSEEDYQNNSMEMSQ